MTYIYGLIDPRNGDLRWVGKSDNPRKRMLQHMSLRTGKAPRIAWFRELRDLGIDPTIVILEECLPHAWREAEKDWIDAMRALGSPLVNAIAGGTGGPHNVGKSCGPIDPDVVQRRIRTKRTLRRRPMTPEGRASLSRAAKRRPDLDAHMEKLAAAVRGKPKSAEHRAKIGDGNRGKTITPDARRKISEAMKGKSRPKRGPMATDHRARVAAGKQAAYERKSGTRDALIRQLRAEGLTWTAIGERVGLAPNSVGHVLKR